MSVIATLQLGKDATPSSGTAVVTRIALGGNGFSAPAAMYAVRNFAVTGDATSGEHTLQVTMDPTYCSMVGYATMQLSAAVLPDVHWQLSGPAVPMVGMNLQIAGIGAAVAGSPVIHTWLPPAMINPGNQDEVPTLELSVLNVDTVILNLNAVVFLFDIRARESALYAMLIAARGGMYQGPQTT